MTYNTVTGKTKYSKIVFVQLKRRLVPMKKINKIKKITGKITFLKAIMCLRYKYIFLDSSLEIANNKNLKQFITKVVCYCNKLLTFFILKNSNMIRCFIFDN